MGQENLCGSGQQNVWFQGRAKFLSGECGISMVHRARQLFASSQRRLERGLLARGGWRGPFSKTALLHCLSSKYQQCRVLKCARVDLDLKSIHLSVLQSQGRAVQICSEIRPRVCTLEKERYLMMPTFYSCCRSPAGVGLPGPLKSLVYAKALIPERKYCCKVTNLKVIANKMGIFTGPNEEKQSFSISVLGLYLTEKFMQLYLTKFTARKRGRGKFIFLILRKSLEGLMRSCGVFSDRKSLNVIKVCK